MRRDTYSSNKGTEQRFDGPEFIGLKFFHILPDPYLLPY